MVSGGWKDGRRRPKRELCGSVWSMHMFLIAISESHGNTHLEFRKELVQQYHFEFASVELELDEVKQRRVTA